MFSELFATSPRCCWKKSIFVLWWGSLPPKYCPKQRAYFLYTRFGISKGHRQIAKAGQACHRRGTSGPWGLEWMGLRDHHSQSPTFTGVGAREARTKGHRSDDLPNIMSSSMALVLQGTPLVRANSLTCSHTNGWHSFSQIWVQGLPSPQNIPYLFTLIQTYLL